MGRIPPPLKNLPHEFQSSLVPEPWEAYRIHARKINGLINEEISKKERSVHVPIHGQENIFS
jgi:hypothetical protein